MKKMYKSKLGLEIIVPMTLVLFGVTTLIVSEAKWAGLFIMIPIIGLIAYIFLATKYTIHGHILNVRCGVFYNKNFDIHQITHVVETNNPMSSPATSLDRLEVKWGKFSSVLISPSDKEGFIRDLLTINENIEVKRKNVG